jgi:Family of unknown function (DUF6035)
MSINHQRRSLTKVMDHASGNLLDVYQFLKRGNLEIVQDRKINMERYRSGNPWLVCGVCRVPLNLCRYMDRSSFFFRHMPGYDEIDCSARDDEDGDHDDDDTADWERSGESRRHKEMKDWIAESLRSDPCFGDVFVEKTIFSTTAEEWRRPDVKATRGGVWHIFEVQLSTTALSTVVDRSIFYREKDAIIVWVFDDFVGNEPKTTELDIYANNFCNLFVVNEESLAESRSSSKFHVWCQYLEPLLEDGKRYDVWRKILVPLCDLKVSKENQLYFYDYYSERLRQDLEHFWLTKAMYMRWASEWIDIFRLFRRAGFDLPREHDDPVFHSIMSILYSAKHGTQIGEPLRCFFDSGHAFEHRNGLVAMLDGALEFFGTSDALRASSPQRDWAAYMRASRHYALDRCTPYDDVIFFLVPGLKERIRLRNIQRDSSHEHLTPLPASPLQSPTLARFWGDADERGGSGRERRKKK